jgi:hypothetical protein
MSITIQQATVDHIPFIANSFIKSLQTYLPYSRLDSPIIAGLLHCFILRAMRSCSVLVAADNETPDQIYGWVMYVPAAALVYLYVKKPFRQYGIGTSLYRTAFPNATVDHPTAVIFSTAATKHLSDKWHLKYDPSKISLISRGE